ncbi:MULTISPECIES: STAS domain-containing protein [Streptomyces]|uniref:STAS domain-containing protein n=1 Tax=Streptomyces salyersiae TaxID=3075530 RepID=A0ABU2RKQ2_9ACTN|nr:STAS domain-containing protein [Streptomyces sp. MBT51]MDT0428024.1 STAS domain-containing protein [Streptomyces sp. DSM 41770]
MAVSLHVDADTPLAFVVTGRVTRADVPGLCAELEALLSAPGTAAVDCDVGAVVCADLVLVEALARLGLVARRAGRRLRLRNVSDELRSLLGLVGLSRVVGAETATVEERPGPGP